MNYADIIIKNRELCPLRVWADCAFHLTDVSNAVEILKTGTLLSRTDALKGHRMRNDNASRQVISMTDKSVTSKVRLYFRPLTPTQYHNEGYKHPELRYNGDFGANIPVPIFLLFDLATLLSEPDVTFSQATLAGHSSERQTESGLDAFSRLPFDKIYDNSYTQLQATKTYRHAELLHPSPMPLAPTLRYILCRNDIERITFLNLLRSSSPEAYEAYKNKIFVPRNNHLFFYNNGIYISQCLFHQNTILITYVVSEGALRYIDYNKKQGQEYTLDAQVVLEWKNSSGILKTGKVSCRIKSESSGSITVRKVPDVQGADILSISVFFNESLVCQSNVVLKEDDLLD